MDGATDSEATGLGRSIMAVAALCLVVESHCNIGIILGLYWDYIGIMDNEMETTRDYKDSFGIILGL